MVTLNIHSTRAGEKTNTRGIGVSTGVDDELATQVVPSINWLNLLIHELLLLLFYFYLYTGVTSCKLVWPIPHGQAKHAWPICKHTCSSRVAPSGGIRGSMIYTAAVVGNNRSIYNIKVSEEILFVYQ
jgi:hypothetical protein